MKNQSLPSPYKVNFKNDSKLKTFDCFSVRETQDFYKGHPFQAFTVKFPQGYSLELTIAQHKSGKVTVHQSISKMVGFFNFKKMKIESGLRDPFDTSMMDKLNKVLWKEDCV